MHTSVVCMGNARSLDVSCLGSVRAVVKPGIGRLGYGIPFFGGLKRKYLRLPLIVCIVLLPEEEAYTVCVRGKPVTYINTEVMLVSLKERTQTWHFCR